MPPMFRYLRCQVFCSGNSSSMLTNTVFSLAVSLSSSGAEILSRQSKQPNFLVRDLVPRSVMSSGSDSRPLIGQ